MPSFRTLESKIKNFDIFAEGPLLSMSQVPQIIINFIKAVRKQYNVNIKCFRSDKFTEYMNEAVKIFLAIHNIRHENSEQLTPMQTDTSEVYNRFIGNAI